LREKILKLGKIQLTFFDPPFNQNKNYSFYNDNLPAFKYWKWIYSLLVKIYNLTKEGGSIYFMQREKNAEFVLKTLRKAGWTFQNLIIWKKMTSAVPSKYRFGKQYQIIAFATKGDKPNVFNRLKIDPPLPPNYKIKRENGIYLTDIWNDIREMTSGYLTGEEALRDEITNSRLHKQQSPIKLLLRIILSSSMPDNLIFDPFAGTGTTAVVANQLLRNSISIEIDSENVKIIKNRINKIRKEDALSQFYEYYKFTENLNEILPDNKINAKNSQSNNLSKWISS